MEFDDLALNRGEVPPQPGDARGGASGKEESDQCHVIS
jgi:hypothetical protein